MKNSLIRIIHARHFEDVWIGVELEKAKNFQRNWEGTFKFLRTKCKKEKMDSEKE